MNTKQLISLLQSRIDRRSGYVKEYWEYVSECNICGYVSLRDNTTIRIKKTEIEQKIDRDILRDLYKLEKLWRA